MIDKKAVVLVVESGNAALSALDAGPDQYSSILMDVAMAGLNGLECTRFIREHKQERDRGTIQRQHQ